MCTQCGTAEESPPTVSYGASTANRIFNEPAVPASSVAPAAAPVGPTEPPMSVTSGTPTTPPPSAGDPSMASAGSGAPIQTPLAGAGGAVALPQGGAGGAGAAGAVGGETPIDPTAGPSPTTLTLEFTTQTQNGRYAPDNVGAVWVESASGQWIHTLEFWGNVPNGSHLNRYLSVKGPDYGSFFGIPVTTVPPDVMTSATLHMHKTHTGLSWNLKNASGSVVPDGAYTLVIELTEAEAPGEFLEIPFDLGPGATSPTPPSSTSYTGIKLTLQ